MDQNNHHDPPRDSTTPGALPGTPIARADLSVRTTDGLTLTGFCWRPAAGRPKAVVVIAHGYAEHGGRYDQIMQTIAANRYTVTAVDHRGHGRSPGPRALVDTIDRYVEDLDRVVDAARQDSGQVPCYLIGHSMGGLIALRYALAYPDKLAGLVLSAPAIKPAQEPTRLQELLVRLIAKVAPGVALLPTAKRSLSSDPAINEAAARDPLFYHGRMKAGQAVAIVEAGREVITRTRYLEMPLLILQGTADQLVDPRGAEQIYRLTNNRAGVDTGMITWPGMQHELLNEPDGAQVLEVIISWLNAHVVEWRKSRSS